MGPGGGIDLLQFCSDSSAAMNYRAEDLLYTVVELVCQWKLSDSDIERGVEFLCLPIPCSLSVYVYIYVYEGIEYFIEFFERN